MESGHGIDLNPTLPGEEPEEVLSNEDEQKKLTENETDKSDLPYHVGEEETGSYAPANIGDESGRSKVHVASLKIPHLHIAQGQGQGINKSGRGIGSSHFDNESNTDDELQTSEDEELEIATEEFIVKEDGFLLTFEPSIESESEVKSSKKSQDTNSLPNGKNESLLQDSLQVNCCNCKTIVSKDGTSVKSLHEFLPSQYYDTGTGDVVNVMIIDAISEVFKIQWTCPNYWEISKRNDLFLCLDCASTLAQLYQLYNQFASLALKSKSFLSAVINFQKKLQLDGIVTDKDGGMSDTEQLVASVSPGDFFEDDLTQTPTWKRKRAVKRVRRYGEEQEEGKGSEKEDNTEDFKLSSRNLQKSVEFFQELNSEEEESTSSNFSIDKAIPPKKRNKRKKKLKVDSNKVSEENNKTVQLVVNKVEVEDHEFEEGEDDDLSFDPKTDEGMGDGSGGVVEGEEENEPLQSLLQKITGPRAKIGTSGKTLKCKDCNKTFMFPIQLRIHLNSQQHRDRLKRIKVEKQDSEDEDRLRPIKIKIRKPNRKVGRSSKNKSKTLTCEECEKSFNTPKELRRHEKSHADGIKAGDCDRCGKNFKTLGGLKIHYAAHVRDDNKYQCKDCGKKFRKQEALELHERTDHGGFKPHSCPHCDKSFRLKDKLKLHVMVIHEKKKPFPCPKCEKAFRTKYHLKIHDVSQHIQGGDTSIGCSQCKRKFPDREALEKHVVVHEQEKPFVCPVCMKGFHTSARLKLHEKSHQEMPSCLCPICGRAYKHVRDLKLHEVVHQDESTYRFGCGDCPRRFYRIDLLRVHQSNEKHFSTEVVGPTVSKSQAGKDTSFFQIRDDALEENEEEDENETDSEQPPLPPPKPKKKRKPVKEKVIRVSSSSHQVQAQQPNREMTVMHPHATVVYHPSTMVQLHLDQSGIVSSGGHQRNESSAGALVTNSNTPSNLSVTSHHQHRYGHNESQGMPTTTTTYILNPRDRQNLHHHHHHQGSIQLQPGGSVGSVPHSHIQIGGNTIYAIRDAAGNPSINEPLSFDVFSSFINNLQ